MYCDKSASPSVKSLTLQMFTLLLSLDHQKGVPWTYICWKVWAIHLKNTYLVPTYLYPLEDTTMTKKRDLPMYITSHLPTCIPPLQNTVKWRATNYGGSISDIMVARFGEGVNAFSVYVSPQLALRHQYTEKRKSNPLFA